MSGHTNLYKFVWKKSLIWGIHSVWTYDFVIVTSDLFLFESTTYNMCAILILKYPTTTICVQRTEK